MFAWLRRCVVAFAMAGCGTTPENEDTVLNGVPLRSEHGDFTCEVMHEQGDFRRGSNSFLVRARDAAGRTASLTLVLARMPAHGHAAVPSLFAPEGAAWRVSHLVLNMPGAWEIGLRLANKDGRQDEAVIRTTVH